MIDNIFEVCLVKKWNIFYRIFVFLFDCSQKKFVAIIIIMWSFLCHFASVFNHRFDPLRHVSLLSLIFLVHFFV